MLELELISIQDIIAINKKYCDAGLLRPSLSAIYSSYLYYDTPEEQIAGIFYNLIKGHYFIDGNKRTACIVLFLLCKTNGVICKIVEPYLYDVAIKAASEHFTIEELVSLLFEVGRV